MILLEVNNAFGCCFDEFKDLIEKQGFMVELVIEQDNKFPSISYKSCLYKTNAPINLVLDILEHLPITKNDYIVGKKSDCIKVIRGW